MPCSVTYFGKDDAIRLYTTHITCSFSFFLVLLFGVCVESSALKYICYIATLFCNWDVNLERVTERYRVAEIATDYVL